MMQFYSYFHNSFLDQVLKLKKDLCKDNNKIYFYNSNSLLILYNGRNQRFFLFDINLF